MRIGHAAPGPPGHGVVRHAAALARLAGRHGIVVVDTDPDLTHVQFTDEMWGVDIAAAAGAFEAWAATAARPLVVTLHDVPGADPDPARDARRGAGYRRVVAACDAVVVSAEHEAAKITALTGRPCTVIDLPIPDPVPGGAEPAWADRPTLVVLGFLYPGKGHDVAVDVAARHGLRVVAAGAGGAWLRRRLRVRAADAGVDLVITGSLTDAAMTAAARAARVPFVPGVAVSASGSLMTWLGCGRRPVVLRGAYAEDLARRRPGVTTVCDPEQVDAVVRHALADPASTHLSAPLSCGAGAAHAALYRTLTRC